MPFSVWEISRPIQAAQWVTTVRSICSIAKNAWLPGTRELCGFTAIRPTRYWAISWLVSTLIPTPATIHEPVGCEKSSNVLPTNSMWRLRAGRFERTIRSRFWANAVTVALKDEHGVEQGYARVVRDFSERHEKDESARRGRMSNRATPLHSTITGWLPASSTSFPK